MTTRTHRLRLSLIIVAIALCLATAANAQQRFADRNYQVRIGLAQGIESLQLQTESSYELKSSEGTVLAPLGSATKLSIEITPGQPGARSYRLVLHHLNARLSHRAYTLAREARERLDREVKLLSVPDAESGEESILVTVGEYTTLAAARNAVREMPSSRPVVFIYEEKLAAEQGEVRAIGPDGRLLGRDPRHLVLLPTRPDGARLQITGLPGKRSSRPAVYRGALHLIIDEKGLLTVVNELWAEHYLYSVTGVEMGGDAPLEALKAQAVAARSVVAARIQRGIVTSPFFDFTDTPMVQAYTGIAGESVRSRIACDATRGEILVWPGNSHGNVAVDAVYSHCCGGVLTSAREMWGSQNEGYTQRKYDRLAEKEIPKLYNHRQTQDWLSRSSDALCNPDTPGLPGYTRNDYRWRKKVSGAKLSREANARWNVGTLKDIEVVERSAAGRVEKLSLIGSRRTQTVKGEQAVRQALGGLKSTLITLSTSRDSEGNLDSVSILGGGFGHGVGMCQMGAWRMASLGYDYRQILGHYYDKVKMRHLY